MSEGIIETPVTVVIEDTPATSEGVAEQPSTETVADASVAPSEEGDVNVAEAVEPTGTVQ